MAVSATQEKIETDNLRQINTPILNNLASGTLLAPTVDVQGLFNNQGVVAHQGDLTITTSNGLISTGTLLSESSLVVQNRGGINLIRQRTRGEWCEHYQWQWWRGAA